MRFLACRSAPMPESLLRELGQVFPGITDIEGYGLSEGGPVTALLPRWGVRRHGSIGLPLPGIETRLVAGDGVTDLGPGAVGELWVRSSMNAAGYHNLPEVTARKFTPDGWLRTGDLVRFDEDGFFFVGRADLV